MNRFEDFSYPQAITASPFKDPRKTMWSVGDDGWRNQLISIVCVYLNEPTLMAVIIPTSPVFLIKRSLLFLNFMVSTYIKIHILKTAFPVIPKVILLTSL